MTEKDPPPIESAQLASIAIVETDKLKAKKSKEEKREVQKKASEKLGSFKDLFYFIEGPEKIMCIFGFTFSIAQGFGMPVFTFIFGNMTDAFSPSNTADKTESMMNTYLIYMVILGGAVLVVAGLASFFWNMIAGKQSSRIKSIYFRKLLYQNTTWYDQRKADEVAANFVDQISSLTAIFSEKIHMLFMNLATVFGGIIIGFIKGWLLTLFILCLTPVMFLAMYFYVSSIMKMEQIGRESYGEAGSVTDECFTFIKTVKSLSGEEHEIERYSKCIVKSRDASIKYGWINSLSWGVFWGVILLIYGMAYLIGSRLISNQWFNSNWNRTYQVGDVLTIFFAIIIGIMSLGQVGPILKSLGSAQIAVASILTIIKNEETEKSGDYKPDIIKGEFVFENVSFSYPSNPDIKVLKNINMSFKPGQKVALVGQSGCGKSTVVGLLQRYYDPSEGRILLDGVDLREYEIKHLRFKMGFVSQQPMLFAESIRFNMTLGTEIGLTNDAEIWKALQLAEAKNFVSSLPKQLDEFVGSLGGQLSGGQKQRIAIARALIRKPDIFLFDEATSALDRTNEMEIQKTIDRIASTNTSVTIAHRLTTIKDADVIFVFRSGEIVEFGNHETLVGIPDGIYKSLVNFQIQKVEEADHPDMDIEVGVELNFKSESVANNIDDKLSKIEFNNEVSLSKVNLQAKITPIETVAEKPRYKSIYSLLQSEKKLIPIGLLAAMVQGAVMPLFGLLMGSMIELMAKLSCFNSNNTTLIDPTSTTTTCPDTQSNVLSQIDAVIGGFAAVAFGAFLFTFIQFATFNILGERFTYNLRTSYFRRLMYQDMKFFDAVENQPGALSSRLATMCKKVNILVGVYLGTIMQSLFSFAIGIILAFIFSWRVSLITLAVSPLIIVSSWVTSKVRMGAGVAGEVSKIDGSEMLTESINNMKIVRSLTAEEALLNKFTEYDAIYKGRLLRTSVISGLLFGLSQFFMFMTYAVVFRVSAKFIADGTLKMEAMFKSMFCLLFGVFGVGQSSQFLSDIDAVNKGAVVILRDLNQGTEIEVDPKNPHLNPRPNSGLRNAVYGKIEFKAVSFQYSGRNTLVLNRFTATINQGDNCALVGSSGCGKSTVMQLLMRFYDPSEGSILIDGIDIKDYALDHLRRSFGIVRQEPSLFNGTIEYNIRYNHTELSEVDLKEAADLSNSTEFIYSTPEGFQRNVGNRGEKLSGGQKQRIAIARVIAQKPKIYLFDEATSALDSQSEELVQKAIETLSSKTTSLTIAHRISTIKNSDCIFVVENGRVIEKGNYDRLMSKNGKFAELARG